MRKVLLISLAAVIVAGGFAMVLYGEGAPRESRPGSQRRGPRGPQLTEAQQADLTKVMEGAVGKKLKTAVADFQKAVKDALKGSIQDEAQLDRAVRMATFRAIMPPRAEGDPRGGGRPERTDRPRKQE